MNVKETVLKKLQDEQKKNEFVSGEKLAELCGVSRTAVWKAVKSLQEEGASIEAVSNSGYRLIAENQFNQKSIEDALKKIKADSHIKIIFFTKTDSTNTQAKKLLLNQSSSELNKTVCIAAEQTQGRGRLGRKFYSPSQTGIYFSIIYAPKKAIEAAKITTQAAVGVCRAIKKIYKTECSIKWVNDIFIGDKKICGILTEGNTNLETGTVDAAVIGIGINIAENKEFPEELKKSAGSIIHESKNYMRSELAAGAISEVIKIIDGTNSVKEKAMEEYKNRSNLTGKKITVTPVIGSKNGRYECTVLGISDDAKLIVKTQDGSTKFLDSGEVSLHSGC